MDQQMVQLHFVEHSHVYIIVTFLFHTSYFMHLSLHSPQIFSYTPYLPFAVGSLSSIF